MSDESLLSKVSIVEIVSDKSPWDGKAAWKVTVAFSHDPRLHVPLTAVFFMSKHETKDDGLVALAKNYFHRLTSKLGEDTTEWALSEEQVASFRKAISQAK